MRLHCLKPIIELIFKHLCHTTKLLNVSKNYIIGIFPVFVYRDIRIKNCRILTGKHYRGFNNSKKEQQYGSKVQIITTKDVISVQFDFFCDEIGDVTAAKPTQINLDQGRNLQGDESYCRGKPQ